MRKIGTADEIDRKRKKNTLLVAWFFIGIMLLSLVGFGLLSGGDLGTVNSEEDGEYYDGNYWVVNEGGQQYYFLYNKEEAANVSIQITNNFGNYAGSSWYIDSENSVVLGEIVNNLGRYAGRIQEACYGQCERDLPERDCSVDIIVFREKDEERVYQEDKCVFIEGSALSADAFLYRVLGL